MIDDLPVATTYCYKDGESDGTYTVGDIIHVRKPYLPQTHDRYILDGFITKIEGSIICVDNKDFAYTDVDEITIKRKYENRVCEFEFCTC